MFIVQMFNSSLKTQQNPQQATCPPALGQIKGHIKDSPHRGQVKQVAAPSKEVGRWCWEVDPFK